jgi:hypothetical protein
MIRRREWARAGNRPVTVRSLTDAVQQRQPSSLFGEVRNVGLADCREAKCDRQLRVVFLLLAVANIPCLPR